MIELIATDMDGTFLKDHTTIHEDNVTAVKRIQAKGVPFIVCTGRDFEQAKMCLEPAGITCPLIALNGAKTYDSDGRLIETNSIPAEEVRIVLQKFAENGLYAEIMTTSGVYSTHYETRMAELSDWLQEQEPGITEEELAKSMDDFKKILRIQAIEDYEEILTDGSQEFLKITAFSKEGQPAFTAVREFVTQEMTDLAITSSFYNNIEVNHIDAQKGVALKKYAKAHGYDLEKTLAFGDNGNDISMLEEVGYGYVMANAEDYVKAISTFHTGANTEGGVAQIINQYFPEN
ncbi:hypothetical protein SAMN05421767_11021 [Granulicatella balaenopterae]|uniref:Cof subfamily of IIB subfamily of haloacid dehalogenase superfamily/HAD-superfamily hydrolase, subfamily IIB n=1 Tax=Granulicatella balaenopterae TaxID=137733 RepID=A0A1H9JST2_9LACT|nr:Cof-type HAD-IIB family hydrolase [Granulicatella balaenopterae]SEQ89823.1 hypothetical protein SAMN05421767_11021 [Granulicatella balaenopterae]